MVILTNSAGNEISPLRFKKIDVDLNDTKDFVATIAASRYSDDIEKNGRIFIPNTEFGGLVGEIETRTGDNEVLIKGRSWRGVLSKKIIKPPKGQAYKVVSGDLNEILKTLIEESNLTELFETSTMISEPITSFKFDRYTDLLSGIEKILKSKGHKLSIMYKQGEQGEPGKVLIEAAKIEDYSSRVELSQDNKLDFTFSQTKNGVNHLICLGKGELTDRVVVDLFLQTDGSIGTVQHYFGVDEVEEVYEDTSAEDENELIEQGKERLAEITNKQSFAMDVSRLNITAEIGDIIGGRDYITGMSLSKPISNKIYTEENGVVKIEYKLEGDDQ